MLNQSSFGNFDNITPTRFISCWKRKQQFTTEYCLSLLDIETDASIIMIPKWNLDMTKGQGTDIICSLQQGFVI